MFSHCVSPSLSTCLIQTTPPSNPTPKFNSTKTIYIDAFRVFWGRKVTAIGCAVFHYYSGGLWIVNANKRPNARFQYKCTLLVLVLVLVPLPLHLQLIRLTFNSIGLVHYCTQRPTVWHFRWIIHGWRNAKLFHMPKFKTNKQNAQNLFSLFLFLFLFRFC